MATKSPAAPTGRRWRLFPSLLILACLLFGTMLGLFIGCSRTEITFPPNASSIVYDLQGQEIGRFFVQNREPVSLSQMPKSVKDAAVAVEDNRFYSHTGIDMRGIARALWQDIRGGEIKQGASTITQQLARNVFLSQRRVLTRKISEAIYALKIERQYSKDQILEAYLNQIYFGHGAYGIQSAAKLYYGKDVSKLTLAQSAMLIGLVKGPRLYDPYLDPKAARDRRETCLDQMVKYGYITQAQEDKAKQEPLDIVPLKTPKRRAAYFMEYVERQLSKRFQQLELDNAGLRIYTTLDLGIQEAADQAVASFMAGIQSKKDTLGVDQPQVALVTLDPGTGYIKAMIGGRDFGITQLNRADYARRQPGSTIKPFLYTAAIDTRAVKPSQIVDDSPKRFGSYRPHNYGGQYRGAITLQEALQYSSNQIACQVASEIGLSKVYSYAKNMGLSNLVASGKANDLNLAALALGGLTRGVTPLEMAGAYTPLANQGIRSEPIAILKVTDQYGSVLLQNKIKQKSVISSATAYVMTNMLRRVVLYGTGAGAYINEYHPVAGKTGTTSDNTNAWFVGYTPNLLASVWLGNDQQGQSLAFGSGYAARLWRAFMSGAVAHVRAGSFSPPAGVTGEIAICRASGELFSDQCPAEDLDYAVFLSGTQPTASCSVHQGAPSPDGGLTPPADGDGTSGTGVNNSQIATTPPVVPDTVTVLICTESGARANPYCPADKVKSVTYRKGEEPTQYCTLHTP